MPRKGNISYFLGTAVVFIVLEAAAVVLLYFKGPVQNLWISQGSYWISANVWGGIESAKHYFSLNKENERLSQENELLMTEIAKYRAEAETKKYAESLDDTLDSFLFIPAKIRKISNNRQHNYLILDKGSADGVKPMSGIITGNGVLGIVDVVSEHYCYARSFKNTDMEVSARLGRDGALGILSWDGATNEGAILNGIPQHIEVMEGDTVFTSGFSGIFPSEIPLGTAGSKTIVNGAYYKVRVKLFEDVGKRRFATIVCNADIDEIRKLEEDGQ